MSEQSLNLLFGMPAHNSTQTRALSTKVAHTSTKLQTTGNSKQPNHDGSRFLARLVDSMKNTPTHDIQTSLLYSSDINNAENFKDIDQIIEIDSLSLSNSIDVSSAPTQTHASTLSDNVLINQEPKALVTPRPNLLKVMNEATTPLSDKLNLVSNISLNNLNKTPTVTGQTSTSAQIQTNTLLDNIFLSQESNALKESRLNLSTIMNETFSLSDKPDTKQSITEGNRSLDKLTEIINNTKNDISLLNIGEEGSNTASQASKALNRHNLISNPMFKTKDNTTSNNTINHNSLLSSEENVNGKIEERLKELFPDKISQANTRKESPSQQGLAKANPDNNESSVIFSTSPNSTEAKSAKLSDNTTITFNNSVNTGDNTSSENSSPNKQGSGILSEFDINSVNTRKSTRPETNFTDTLSHINNSSKPLGILSSNVTDNIIQSAKLYMKGGKPEIKIQLNPPELGSLKLEFAVDDDILETKITVERSAVKDIIEKDIPRLRELISTADIDVGKLDVSLQEKENDRSGFKDKNLQPDSENNGTQDSLDWKKEDFENEDESITNNLNPNQINYLV